MTCTLTTHLNLLNLIIRVNVSTCSAVRQYRWIFNQHLVLHLEKHSGCSFMVWQLCHVCWLLLVWQHTDEDSISMGESWFARDLLTRCLEICRCRLLHWSTKGTEVKRGFWETYSFPVVSPRLFCSTSECIIAAHVFKITQSERGSVLLPLVRGILSRIQSESILIACASNLL